MLRKHVFLEIFPKGSGATVQRSEPGLGTGTKNWTVNRSRNPYFEVLELEPPGRGFQIWVLELESLGSGFQIWVLEPEPPERGFRTGSPFGFSNRNRRKPLPIFPTVPSPGRSRSLERSFFDSRSWSQILLGSAALLSPNLIQMIKTTCNLLPIMYLYLN